MSHFCLEKPPKHFECGEMSGMFSNFKTENLVLVPASYSNKSSHWHKISYACVIIPLPWVSYLRVRERVRKFPRDCILCVVRKLFVEEVPSVFGLEKQCCVC